MSAIHCWRASRAARERRGERVEVARELRELVVAVRVEAHLVVALDERMRAARERADAPREPVREARAERERGDSMPAAIAPNATCWRSQVHALDRFDDFGPRHVAEIADGLAVDDDRLQHRARRGLGPADQPLALARRTA